MLGVPSYSDHGEGLCRRRWLELTTLNSPGQPCQRGLAVEEWEIAHILAVMLDQVEGVEDCGSSTLPTTPRNRDPPAGTTASPSIVKLLALDLLGGSHDRRQSRGPVIRIAAIKPHRGTITPDDIR
jgi:hypothetical protein